MVGAQQTDAIWRPFYFDSYGNAPPPTHIQAICRVAALHMDWSFRHTTSCGGGWDGRFEALWKKSGEAQTVALWSLVSIASLLLYGDSVPGSNLEQSSPGGCFLSTGLEAFLPTVSLLCKKRGTKICSFFDLPVTQQQNLFMPLFLSNLICCQAHPDLLWNKVSCHIKDQLSSFLNPLCCKQVPAGRGS